MRTAHPRYLRLASLLLAALACVPARAETLTVTNIAGLDRPGFTLNVPEVRIVDGNLTEAQVRALFAGPPDSAELGALASLTAASLEIPDITVSYTVPSSGGTTKSSVEYKDIKLTNVVNGVAGQSSIGEISIAADPTTPTNFRMTLGEFTSSQFGIAAILGFYGIGPAGGGTDFMPVYKDFHSAGGKFTWNGGNCTLGPSDLADFSVRPLKTSLLDISAITQDLQAAQQAGKEPTPQQLATVINFYIDLFTAMRSSPTTIGAVDCSVTEDGQASTFSIAGIGMGGFDPGTYPSFSFDGFKFETPGVGQFTLGNFTFKKTDLTGPIAALQGADGKFSDAWFTQHALELVPAFDGLAVKGFSGDFPDPTGAGKMHVALDDLDFTLGNYILGVPLDVSATAAGLDYPIPANAQDETARALRGMGIDDLKMDLGTEYHWDEANETLVVDQLLVDTDQLGRVEISGTLGNATSELIKGGLFTSMLTGAPGAPAQATTLTVKNAVIDLTDHGAGKLIIAAGAKEAKQTEPLYRIYLAGILQGMTMAVLGNTDDSLKVAKALGDFIMGSPEVRLTITSVDPDGVSIASLLQASGDPTKLAGKFTVVAETVGAAPANPNGDGGVQQEKLGLKAPAKPR